MAVPTVAPSRLPGRLPALPSWLQPASGPPVWRRPWPLTAVGVLLLSVIFVLVTGVRPAYDAYGWLVWGHQAVGGHLDTTAAPSWKPLTFLFTFPYTLVLAGGALWAWMVTAAAAGFAAPIFAGRIAFQLTEAPAERRYAAWGAAVFAAAGVLGIEGYWHFMLISTADPMMVALCLAAIDAALHRRFGWAWALLVLVCLGRPEATLLALIFAAWCWRRVPSLRRGLLIGLGAIAVLWFGIPLITAGSAMSAGNVLSESTNPLTGNKFLAVMRGLLSLYELPMQIAVVGALSLAAALRERTWLLLGGISVGWLAVEVGFALHGWGIAPRYMFEPGAVLIVLAGAAAGRLLAVRLRRLPWLRWLSMAAVLAIVATLAPQTRVRGRLVHNGIVLGRTWARQLQRLHDVIAWEGGTRRVLACGQPVTTVSYQSILAWELGVNVIDVGWKPSIWTSLGTPVVLFQPVHAGWQIRPINTSFTGNPSTVTVSTHPSTTRERLQNQLVHRSLVTFFGHEHHAVPAKQGSGTTSASACARMGANTPTN